MRKPVIHRHRLRLGVLAGAAAALALGVPFAGTALGSDAGGAQKPRPATFGDCKNENPGVHNGYVCEPASGSVGAVAG